MQMTETKNTAQTMDFSPFRRYTRFGVMGGSFDPVHIGHLSIAQQVCNHLNLETVFLMPAAQPPHKRGLIELASEADRLEMCRLAVFNMHGLEVSDLELRKGGVSYTVDTARMLRDVCSPETTFYFIIGSDSLADLPQWYEIHELLKIARFATAERREKPLQVPLWCDLEAQLGSDAVKRLKEDVVPVQRVDISSTLIRKMLKEGEKIPGYLRRDVDEYIRKKGLYGCKSVGR